VTGLMHTSDLVISPPDIGRPGRRDVTDTPRSSPLEWARRRRTDRETKKVVVARERAKGRLHRLGAGWYVFDAPTLGLGANDAFLAIGPGGLFAVTVRSQGRHVVRISGSVVQINGRRLDYMAEAQKFAHATAKALSRTAGVRVPVTPVLAFTGSGLMNLYGLPKDCVVMPYRELDHLFHAYGERIALRTVEKLASVARHPATVIDLRLGPAAAIGQ
jgi:hypothetical protein